MVTKGLCKCFMLAVAPTPLEGCQNLLEPASAQCLWLGPALSGERICAWSLLSLQQDPDSAHAALEAWPAPSASILEQTGNRPTREPGKASVTVPTHLAGPGGSSVSEAAG